MGAHIVLHQRGEQRLRDAEADRAGREIDVVGVLGARGIALRALVAAERLHPLAGLAAEQILDGVEDRARMRLHRDAVLWPQHVEIERGHDGGERRGRRLVAAHLEAVDVLAHVVRVVDHVAREPQHLALELAENAKLVAGDVRLFAHGCLHLLGPHPELTTGVADPLRMKVAPRHRRRTSLPRLRGRVGRGKLNLDPAQGLRSPRGRGPLPDPPPQAGEGEGSSIHRHRSKPPFRIRSVQGRVSKDGHTRCGLWPSFETPAFAGSSGRGR